MEKEQMLDLAQTEMLGNRGRSVEMQFDLLGLVNLVGLVQLACRHPEVSPQLQSSAHRFVDSVESTLLAAELPGLALLVAAGWDKQFDG